MTISDFITKYNNKYVEVVDASALNQCFDLVLQWCIEIGIPKTIFPFGNAYQIYSNFGASQAVYFDRIFNGPSASPREGDIVVWDWYYNYAGGHTGVATGKGVTTGSYSDWFEAFEQNDPTKSPSHLKTYSYSHVMGWLRPKNYNLPLTDAQKLQKIKDIINTSISDTDFRNKTRSILGV